MNEGTMNGFDSQKRDPCIALLSKQPDVSVAIGLICPNE
jgi:hypothetical protein